MRRTIGYVLDRGDTADIFSAVEDTSQWRRKYLKVLKVELQDIIEDVKMMIMLSWKRKASGEITNYVCWQNTALFHREIKGVVTLLKDLYTVDPNRYRTLEEMVQYINHMFEKSILKYDFPQAVHVKVKCKFAKVSKYILSSHIEKDI